MEVTTKMMTRATQLIIFVFALALLATACSQSSESPEAESVDRTSAGFAKNADGYADITVAQLDEMMSDKDFALVNVHVPFEGDIPQTDLSIQFDRIADNVDQLPDRDAPIVLYCRSGNMSTQAAKTLTELGYSNVMELDGGFNAWKAAGHPMAGE
jgi:rhodanese-related sulfurtransferase